MRTNKLARQLSPILLALLVTVACGGGGDAPENPPADESPAAPQPKTEAKATLCDLIPKEAVGPAFGGKLKVTGLNTADDSNCLYDLGLATEEALEGAQLIVQTVQPALYEAEKEQWQGKDNYEALAGLGRDAHVLNQAQVNVLVDDDTAIRVGLLLITMGEEPPLTKEEARAGVIELATGLAEHL